MHLISHLGHPRHVKCKFKIYILSDILYWKGFCNVEQASCVTACPLKAFLKKAFIDLESTFPIHAEIRMEWRFTEVVKQLFLQLEQRDKKPHRPTSLNLPKLSKRELK